MAGANPIGPPRTGIHQSSHRVTSTPTDPYLQAGDQPVEGLPSSQNCPFDFELTAPKRPPLLPDLYLKEFFP